MIPAFTAAGYLPIGTHRARMAEVVKRFGRINEQRQALAAGLHRVYAPARRMRCKRLLIDGSFVTDKEAIEGEPPNDVDCVLWMPDNWRDLKARQDADYLAVAALADGELHPLVDLFLAYSQQTYEDWQRMFGQAPDGTARGMVEVVVWP